MMRKNDDYYRGLLMSKRSDVITELGYLCESATGDRRHEPNERAFTYSFHMADQGSVTLERETAFSLVAREGDKLSVLNDALRRIEHGTFGVCQMCGGPIEDKRLEAIPDAELCISCQVGRERMRRPANG